MADDVVMDTGRFLGVGTTTLMHTINPSMFLFGGAMTFGRNGTPLGRRFLQAIKDEVKKRAFHVPFERTIIDFATLGGDAGYIGAAGCAVEIRPEMRFRGPVLPAGAQANGVRRNGAPLATFLHGR